MMFQELMQAGIQERRREAEEIERQHLARRSQQPDVKRPRSGPSKAREARLPVLALLPHRHS